jgi:hypothetical protein
MPLVRPLLLCSRSLYSLPHSLSVQARLDAAIDADGWDLRELDYDSDSMVSQAASRYARAAPGAAALGSSPRSPHSSPAAGSIRSDRYLQLIHGELSNISASLRVVANHTSSGTSRGSAKSSIERLLNTDAAEDENGQFTEACFLARSPAI